MYALLPPASDVVIPFWKEDIVRVLYEAAGAQRIMHDAAGDVWSR